MTEIGTDIGSATLAAVLAEVARKKVITRGDVAVVRSADGGLTCRAEAEAMFAIERGKARKCRAWGDLLVETMLDYVVWGERPTGVVTPESATWLLAQVGTAPTPASLALLVAVLDEASTVPPSFAPAVRTLARRAFGAATPLLREAA